MIFKHTIAISVLFVGSVTAAADEPLPGTAPLTIDQPLDVVMVDGIDRYGLRELAAAREQRLSRWQHDHSSVEAYGNSIRSKREQFRTLIGAVDPKPPARGLELLSSSAQDSLLAENEWIAVHSVRWAVLEGVTAEGLWLRQKRSPPVARVVAIPDADWTPEMIVGLEASPTAFARHLASMGCEVLVPTLISRDDTHSANPDIGRVTNQTHREFIYRQAFELGRHIIGYEVQKVLAGVDQLALRNQTEDVPIAVMGAGEGGLLALYSGALDERIDLTVVSGYFDQREQVWQEPIYRNVWRLLRDFGDAEIASMIAPRRLLVEVSPKLQEIPGPPPPRDGRRGAAPGAIVPPRRESVMKEFGRAKTHWRAVQAADGIQTIGVDGKPPLNVFVIAEAVRSIDAAGTEAISFDLERHQPNTPGAEDRQRRQLAELIRFTQRRLALSHRTRDTLFAQADRASVNSWTRTSTALRDHIYRELIGMLPTPTMAPNPRSRQVLEAKKFTGYEVMLDVYPDVIAGGILLLPKDLAVNERRPVVVCQHGLEGTPMATIGGPESRGYRAYKAFAAELANRGFIVYAPQNPYRGGDRFRTLQRKSNPLGRSLFSYIIPQHLVTLRWLASLPHVDRDRIGFYGLSYGGKTAVRVPPLLPPTDSEPGYCLSICSADFNEWVAKNASYDARFSYLWTGEYEIFEWNMGHVANYAELSMLMTPRPFMVERGHDDGVGIDEWVAWEYAKVRRHYNKLGIGDQTEIEFFDGPHTINGQGTYQFLHKHLNWPVR